MPTETSGTMAVVDDEEMVVTSIRSYMQLETRHEIHTFTVPDRALEELRDVEVDVVVADFMMPEMDGITFLKQMRRDHPRATRVLLTGYADKANAIRGINEVDLYQYIEKPWENDRLKLVVQNAVERAQLLRDLESRMEELEEAHDELSDLRNRLIETFL